MAGEINLMEEVRRREEQRRRAAQEPRPETDGRQWQIRTGEGSADGQAETPEKAETAEEAVETTAYGYYRGVRERATNIEFQPLEGSWLGPGYAWLPCPKWVPSGARGQEIVLEYVTGLTVTLRGRNLLEMYERILRQLVFRITEMGEDADTGQGDAVIVYEIDVKEPESEEHTAAGGRKRSG